MTYIMNVLIDTRVSSQGRSDKIRLPRGFKVLDVTHFPNQRNLNVDLECEDPEDWEEYHVHRYLSPRQGKKKVCIDRRDLEGYVPQFLAKYTNNTVPVYFYVYVKAPEEEKKEEKEKEKCKYCGKDFSNLNSHLAHATACKKSMELEEQNKQ